MGTSFDSWIGPALGCLTPAVYDLWRSRVLRRHLDDPAFPERRLASVRRGSVVLWGIVAVLAGVWTPHAYWSVPIAIVGSVAARFPLRRLVLGETWSFLSFVWFSSRLLTVFLGFWVLVAVAPLLTDHDGALGWVIAAALAAVLLAWHSRFVEISRWLLGATPIDDPKLVARFAALVGATGVPAPSFERIAPPGGMVANAVVLPSLRQSSVLVGQAFLDRLDDDEVTAVVAHELAHLEQYDAARLRARRRLVVALIVLATAMAPALRLMWPVVPMVWFVGWGLALASALAFMSRFQQQLETESDLRALALTGNAGALICALTKIHSLAFVPRRSSAALERRASHPSLARRIQAIRRAADRPAEQLGQPARFAAPAGPAAVTFYPDRLAWMRRNKTGVTLPYDALEEIRVDVGVGGAARLLAVDHQRRRWTMPLSAPDVARAQEVLDVIDAHLPAPRATPSLAVRLLAAVFISVDRGSRVV